MADGLTVRPPRVCSRHQLHDITVVGIKDAALNRGQRRRDPVVQFVRACGRDPDSFGRRGQAPDAHVARAVDAPASARGLAAVGHGAGVALERFGLEFHFHEGEPELWELRQGVGRKAWSGDGDGGTDRSRIDSLVPSCCLSLACL